MELTKVDLNKIGKEFKWNTMDGRTLSLREMTTKHIFNSMKMIFNHIAEKHGGEPIWHNHRYTLYDYLAKNDLSRLVRQIALFCYEIEKRQDLPEQYCEPYMQIVNQILGAKQLTNIRRIGKSEIKK